LSQNRKNIVFILTITFSFETPFSLIIKENID